MAQAAASGSALGRVAATAGRSDIWFSLRAGAAARWREARRARGRDIAPAMSPSLGVAPHY
jgi:hypothetical protein